MSIDQAPIDPESVAELQALRKKAGTVRGRLGISDRAKSVNLIFQGGGALGMAHAGALLGLEAIGLVPRSAAGTSAGAIVATLVVAHLTSRSNSQSTARYILDSLMNMPARRFLDGSASNRSLLSFVVKRPKGLELVRAIPGALAAARRLATGRPLYLGGAFSAWLDDRLYSLGYQDTDSLVGQTGNLLKVCATAMPYGLKFVFPDHLSVVDIPRKMLRPSFMARCSMSIPFVFRPVDVPLAAKDWTRLCMDQLCDSRPIREIVQISESRKIRLVDGGLLSNVPLDLLSNEDEEACPTIAIRLYSSRLGSSNRKAFTALNKPMSMIASMFNSARGIRDLEASRRTRGNGQVKSLFVDTGKENWLDFSQDPAVMRRLIHSGIMAVGGYR